MARGLDKLKRRTINDENTAPYDMTPAKQPQGVNSPLASNDTLYNMPDPTLNLPAKSRRTASLRQSLTAQQAKELALQTLLSRNAATQTGARLQFKANAPGGLLSPPSSSEARTMVTPSTSSRSLAPLVEDPTSPSPTRPRSVQASPGRSVSRRTPSRMTTPTALSRRAFYPPLQMEDQEEEEEEDIVPVNTRKRGPDASFLREIQENGWDQEIQRSPIKVTYLAPQPPSPSRRRATSKSKTPQPPSQQRRSSVTQSQLHDDNAEADLSNTSIKSSSSTASNQGANRNRRGRSSTAASNVSRRSMGRLSAPPPPAGVLLGDVTTDRPSEPESPGDDPLLLIDPNIVIYSGNPNSSFHGNRSNIGRASEGNVSASFIANHTRRSMYADSPSMSRTRARSASTALDAVNESTVSAFDAIDPDVSASFVEDVTLSRLTEEDEGPESQSISDFVVGQEETESQDASLSMQAEGGGYDDRDNDADLFFGQNDDGAAFESDTDEENLSDADMSIPLSVNQTANHSESISQSVHEEANASKATADQDREEDLSTRDSEISLQVDQSQQNVSVQSQPQDDSRDAVSDIESSLTSIGTESHGQLEASISRSPNVAESNAADPIEISVSQSAGDSRQVLSSVVQGVDNSFQEESFASDTDSQDSDESQNLSDARIREEDGSFDVHNSAGDEQDHDDDEAGEEEGEGEEELSDSNVNQVSLSSDQADITNSISELASQTLQSTDVVDEMDLGEGESSLSQDDVEEDESSRLEDDLDSSNSASLDNDVIHIVASNSHMDNESEDETEDIEAEEEEIDDDEESHDGLESSVSLQERVGDLDQEEQDEDDSEASYEEEEDDDDDNETNDNDDDDDDSKDIAILSSASATHDHISESPHIHTLHLRQPGLLDVSDRSHATGDVSHSQSRVLKLSQQSSTPIVEISSLDPRAAARATAILKLFHKYVDEGWLSGADVGDASGMTTATGERMQQLVDVMRRVNRNERPGAGASGSAAADLTSIMMDAELSLAREDTAESESVLGASRATSTDGSAARVTPRNSLSAANNALPASPATPFLPGGFRSPARSSQQQSRSVPAPAPSLSRAARSARLSAILQPPPSDQFNARAWTAQDWMRLDKYFVTGLRVISKGMLNAQLDSAAAVHKMDKVEAYLQALLGVDVDLVAERFLDDMQIDARSGRTLEWSSVKLAYRLQALQRKYVKKVQDKYPGAVSSAQWKAVEEAEHLDDSINTEDLNWSLAANTTAHTEHRRAHTSAKPGKSTSRQSRLSFGTPYRTGAHSTPAAGLKKTNDQRNPVVRVQKQAKFDQIYSPAPSGNGIGDEQVQSPSQVSNGVLSRTSNLISRLSGAYFGFGSPGAVAVREQSDSQMPAKANISSSSKAQGKRKALDVDLSIDEDLQQQEVQTDRPAKRPITALRRVIDKEADMTGDSSGSSSTSSLVKSMGMSVADMRPNASLTNATSFGPTETSYATKPRLERPAVLSTTATASMRGNLYPTVQPVLGRTATTSISAGQTLSHNNREAARVLTTGRQLQGGSSSVSHTPLSLLSPRTHQQAAVKVNELRASREARNWKSPRGMTATGARNAGPVSSAGRSMHQVLGDVSSMAPAAQGTGRNTGQSRSNGSKQLRNI